MTARTPFHYHHSAPPPPRVAPLPLAPGTTLLVLGDGITAAEPGYVSLIAQALARTRPDLGLRVLNAGLDGDTLHSALARLDRDVLAHDPAWVAVHLGLGEARGGPGAGSPDELTGLARALLARLRDTGIGVILLTTTVAGEQPDSRANRLLRDYNAALRALAAETGARLVDVWQAFADAYDRAAAYKQEVALTTDGVHPNLQGHALIARTFLAAVGLLDRPTPPAP